MTRTDQPARPRGPGGMRSLVCAALLVALAVGAGIGAANAQPKTALKTESFAKDPGWEGHNNRVIPERLPTVVQNFGYSKTNFAGKETGELGGQVTRASHAGVLRRQNRPRDARRQAQRVRHLRPDEDRPRRRHLLRLLPGRATRRGRPSHRVAGHEHGLRAQRRSFGRAAHYGPEPELRHVRHAVPPRQVSAHPDPPTARATGGHSTMIPRVPAAAANSNSPSAATAPQPGEFSKADIPESHKEEARRRFPDVTAFTVDLPEGYRKQGTTFDHFGLMNMMKPGGSMSLLLRRSEIPRTHPGLFPRTRSGTPPGTAPRISRRTSAAPTTSVSAPPTTPAARPAKSAAPSGAPASTPTTPTGSAR